MYILVEVIERDIEPLKLFDTYEEAYKAMCQRLADVTKLSLEEVETLSPDDCLDSFGRTTESAWATENDINYDWTIFAADNSGEAASESSGKNDVVEEKDFADELEALAEKYGMSKEDSALIRRAVKVVRFPLGAFAEEEMRFRLPTFLKVRKGDMENAVDSCLCGLEAKDYDPMFDYDRLDKFLRDTLDDEGIRHS